ncbi:MAG: hypothetical protein F4139_16050 [Gemmatimonadetes bacterium]|nr:hypothetical protein [Gemmatimonadota bacterium]MYA64466.1 hypothetical protein [Gemmatimonadota bacterium]MYB98991.1 hypothetical protein [Gemmatimonadota bacterium]MYH54428.1 hypothetical protein [Gemmatimonadota bacterium]MYI44784.1 hypothetical protein [Gemmatimonadota bacterium]
MNLRDLMSGIGVVIDDALGRKVTGSDSSDRDRIVDIVRQFENLWCTPFYRASQMPEDDMWDNLLESAGFILLDWRLWPSGARELERHGIARNVAFLERAKAHSVPVFIFTNEDTDQIEYELQPVYDGESLKRSFVFIQRKGDLLSNDLLSLDAVEDWVRGNPSVYTLKTWDRVLGAARRDLFGSMYARSPEWPRVFWNEYVKDGVDPSSALTELITDSLRGRMQASAFETSALGIGNSDDLRAPGEDLHALLSATTVLDTVPEHEVRCGDLFDADDGGYLLNIRPDCDCVPRDGRELGEIELYCIEGKIMEPKEVRKKYRPRGGYLEERINQAIVFAAGDGRSIDFDFARFRVEKFEVWKNRRVGRLLHPYLTRIQQRYALFLQRQGLPRVPRQALPR